MKIKVVMYLNALLLFSFCCVILCYPLGAPVHSEPFGAKKHTFSQRAPQFVGAFCFNRLNNVDMLGIIEKITISKIVNFNTSTKPPVW
jgi:hypothetical protein